MLPQNDGGAQVAERRIEKVFNRMMERKGNGVELGMKNSRLAFLAACTSSGITDPDQAQMIIVRTFEKIAVRRKGKTGKPKRS